MRVLLHSGGIDSSAIARWMLPDACITIDYGQPAYLGEWRAAKASCADCRLKHDILSLQVYREGARKDGCWPGRNQFLVAAAAAHYGHHDNLVILLGILKDDVYSDCSLEFVAQLNSLFALQGVRVSVEAPAARLDCVELLSQTAFPIRSLGATFSCHLSPIPCGKCAGCQKQREIRRKINLCDAVSRPQHLQ